MKIAFLFLTLLPLSAAEETLVTPQIESVGLFKNGVAVIRASFEIKDAGVYCWQGLPTAVHGSFWVESSSQVAVRSTTRMVEDDGAASSADSLQQELAGKRVNIRFKEPASAQPTVAGIVTAFPATPTHRNWNHDLPAINFWSNYGVRDNSRPGPLPVSDRFLILDQPGQRRTYVDVSSIATLETDSEGKTVRPRIEKPVLLFEIGAPPAPGSRVTVSYLSRGIAWAPSYRFDLDGKDQLTIRRSAVVRNELLDLKDTTIELISGFPNIEFAHVNSPLWADNSLSAFFQQLGQEQQSGAPAVTQQRVMANFVSNSNSDDSLPELPEATAGGDDIHFEAIGKRSLTPGDSLSLDLGSSTTACQRVVEWVVADKRDRYGLYPQSGSSRNSSDEDPAWDALKFSNPFPLPLTTAPAMITDGGRFRGQSLSQWVNSGQPSFLRVTKALSIQTRASEEQEEGQQPEIVRIAGNDYQRTQIKATLMARNFRSQEATMILRAGFSGELLAAEENPALKLRVESIDSVNPRRELTWTITLPPGVEKTLTYRYSVLVRR